MPNIGYAPNKPVTIIIASTGESCLGSTMDDWQRQTFIDFDAYVNVDVFEDSQIPWITELPYFYDKRFHTRFSIGLQGLRKSWHPPIPLDTTDFLCLAPGDYHFPKNYVEVCRNALRRNPDLGFLLIPSIQNPDNEQPWSLFTTRECWLSVGEFHDFGGSGGVGMVYDWRKRAVTHGFTGGILRGPIVDDVGVSVQHTFFDGSRDSLIPIEGDKAFSATHGQDWFYADSVYGALPWVGNDGGVVDKFSDVEGVRSSFASVRASVRSFTKPSTSPSSSPSVVSSLRLGMLAGFELAKRYVPRATIKRSLYYPLMHWSSYCMTLVKHDEHAEEAILVELAKESTSLTDDVLLCRVGVGVDALRALAASQKIVKGASLGSLEQARAMGRNADRVAWAFTL